MDSQDDQSFSDELVAALEPLSRGESVDGKPLDFGRIAAEGRAIVQKLAKEESDGQARTAQKLRTRRFND